MNRQEYFKLLDGIFGDREKKAIIFHVEDLRKELVKLTRKKPIIKAELFKRGFLDVEGIYKGQCPMPYFEVVVNFLCDDICLQTKSFYFQSSLPKNLKVQGVGLGHGGMPAYFVLNPDCITTVLKDDDLYNIGLNYDFTKVVPFVNAIKKLQVSNKASKIMLNPQTFYVGNLSENGRKNEKQTNI